MAQVLSGWVAMELPAVNLKVAMGGAGVARGGSPGVCWVFALLVGDFRGEDFRGRGPRIWGKWSGGEKENEQSPGVRRWADRPYQGDRSRRPAGKTERELEEGSGRLFPKSDRFSWER